MRRAMIDPPSDSHAHAFLFNQTPYSLSSVPYPAHAREIDQGRLMASIFTAVCVPMTFSGPLARITTIEEPCFVRLRSMVT